MRALAWNPETAMHEPAVLAEVNRDLERRSAEYRVRWALDHLPGEHALSSSFGAQAAVSLHMVTRQKPSLPVVLVDTGYLFPETYRFIDDLVEQLELNLKVYQPRMSAAWLEARHGRLWEQGVDGIERYNDLRKTEPYSGYEQYTFDVPLPPYENAPHGTVIGDCWHRFYVRMLEVVQAIRMIFDYLRAHHLPYHPLWHEGYVSIGDWHTTRTLAEAGDAEATRFFGLKRECGIHGLEG